MFMPAVFHENLFDDLFDPFWNDGALERAMNREERETFGKRGANMMKTDVKQTADGNYDVASKGLGNTALGLGIAGLATSLLGGGASLFNLGRGNNGTTSNPSDPDARFVTKGEANLMQENSTLKTELAIQKSENYTDKKMVDVTQYLDGKIRQLENKVDANKDAQQAVNAQQMAYNAAANANIDVLKSQVASLTSVTKLMIPSGNVCQMGCGCACNQ